MDHYLSFGSEGNSVAITLTSNHRMTGLFIKCCFQGSFNLTVILSMLKITQKTMTVIKEGAVSNKAITRGGA